MTDRLQALVVREEDFAREELADVLEGLVRFTANGELILDDSFGTLTTTQKVTCLLLACRAAQLLGLRQTYGATPAQLADMSGMPPGSVRPKLSELAKLRLVTKEGSTYFIPIHAGRKAARIVAGGA
jgi:hypothetical protein